MRIDGERRPAGDAPRWLCSTRRKEGDPVAQMSVVRTIGEIEVLETEGSGTYRLRERDTDEYLGSAPNLKTATLFAAALALLDISDDGAEVTIK